MSVVFLNPTAGGRRAAATWQRVMANDPPRVLREARILDERPEAARVAELFRQGKRLFIAAGGDGTAHALMNSLLQGLSGQELEAVCFGAVGIGSSNDYHKPHTAHWIRVNPEKARMQDVLKIDYIDTHGAAGTRYAFLNASIGFCAEANHTFNTGTGLLGILKKGHTSLAIGYSILQTLLRHKSSKNVLVTLPGALSFYHCGNLHAVKSNHVAGGLCYDGGGIQADGAYAVHIASATSRRQLAGSLLQLARNRFTHSRRHQSLYFTDESLSLQSTGPFQMECDGELLQVQSARISLKPDALRCCQPALPVVRCGGEAP